MKRHGLTKAFALLLVLGLLVAGCGQAGSGGGNGAGDSGSTSQPSGGGSSGGSSAKTPIKIGVVVSVTGPASSLGTPEKNTVDLYRSEYSEIGGHPVEWIVLDDESDPTKAVVAAKRLIDEDNVAAIVCCTTSPNSMALLETVAAEQIPKISIAAAASIVEPVSDRYWVFKTPQNDALMIDVLTDYMVAKGHTNLAFIGFNDAYGDGGKTELEKLAPGKGITISAAESYARTDTDVTAQITRMAGVNPDAHLIWAIPPGANVAHQNMYDLGIQQPIYQSHGVANPQFIELGGEAVEGSKLPAGKLLVADYLPDSDEQKQGLIAYRDKYEAQFGKGTYSTFGGHMLDAMFVLEGALSRALAGGADPGNMAGFRATLRDEIEKTTNLVGITGIYNYTPDDHHGMDRRAAIMVTVENGQWVVAD